MEAYIKHFADHYLQEMKEGNAAIFAGAGLSAGAGYVNWKELLRGVANELRLDIEKETDLIALAQYYENSRGGRGSINSRLVREFTKDADITRNHRLLAQTPIKTYWTTNYDNLIERSLESYGKTTDIKITKENLAISVANKDVNIYKMHGCVSQAHDAVITKDDYETYNDKRQLFTTALQGDLVSKTFLFLGFSFDDPNLEYILSRIRVLLGNNQRDHYCFFKKVSEADFDSKDDYYYAQIKQELKIRDLKRYSIQALLIEKYDDITEFLEYINMKIKRRNIFISGAAHDYGKWNGENLVYNIANNLAKNDYRIISGFGLGIGSSVINGTLAHVYSGKESKINNQLLLRPFPQNIIDPEERKNQWKKYRQDMLSEAGVAIFVFGNKLGDDEIVLSDGLLEEFEIALELGVKVIPIGATGSMSKKLWERVNSDVLGYLPDVDEVIETFVYLGDEDLSEKDLINNTMKIVNLLQNFI